MKIRPVGAELFHADGRTDGRTDRHATFPSKLRSLPGAIVKLTSTHSK